MCYTLYYNKIFLEQATMCSHFFDEKKYIKTQKMAFADKHRNNSKPRNKTEVSTL